MPAPDRMSVDEAMAETVTELISKQQPVEYVEVVRDYADLLPVFNDRFNIVKPLIEKNRVLAAEVRRLRAEADAREEAAKERGIRWAYMNDIGTAKTVTDAVARWRQAQGRTGNGTGVE